MPADLLSALLTPPAIIRLLDSIERRAPQEPVTVDTLLRVSNLMTERGAAFVHMQQTYNEAFTPAIEC